jgi:CubicO group peptidase (beta-lactamase class C family)
MLVPCWFFLFFAGATPLRGAADEYVQPYVTSNNFSGAVLVVRDGRAVLDRGYGLANVEHNVPATTSTRFALASLSKMFTAAAILQLRDGGHLSLDGPLRRYIPSFPNSDRITIRQLLTHRSGLRQDTSQPEYFAAATHPYTLAEAVDRIAEAPPAAEPGAKRIYANPNYVVLAMIVERASGEPYAAYLNRHLFEPLGMTRTSLNKSSLDLLPGRSQGYSAVGVDGLENARFYESSIGTGAGSAWSTTGDLRRWMDGLKIGSILSKKSVAELFGDENSQGFVGNPIDLDGRRGVEVTGWDGAGFASTIIFLPSTDLLTIVLANRNVAAVATTLAETLARAESGVAVQKLEIDRSPVPASLLEKAAGRYQLGNDFFVPNTVLEFVPCDGHLCERQNDGKLVGLVRLSNGDFIHRGNWGRVVFEFGDDGRARGLQFFDRFEATRIQEDERGQAGVNPMKRK